MTRIQAARQRAATARRRLAILASAAFVVVFGLAAESHGGSSTPRVDQPAAASNDTSAFDFGSPDVAPSPRLEPQLQTQTS